MTRTANFASRIAAPLRQKSCREARRLGLSLLLLLGVLSLSLFRATSVAQETEPKSPTLSVDKLDYAPGETVVITGTNWYPGETVTLLLREDPSIHADRSFLVNADMEGNVSYTGFAPEPHDVGVTFTLTASGQVSGAAADVQFTDAPIITSGLPGDYSIAQSTGGIVPGTANLFINCDDCGRFIGLPFPFRLYERTFGSAFVSANGNVQFDSGSGQFSNFPLNSGNTSLRYSIVPYWDDLWTFFPGQGQGVFTALTGAPPNRVFHIEWRTAFFIAPNGVPLNFEVSLFEGQNRFDITYGGTNESFASPTIGVVRTFNSNFTQFGLTNQRGNVFNGLRLTFTTGTADLSISKDVSAPSIVAGTNVTYTIAVGNNGPDAASNVVVTDNLPAEVAFVSCSTLGGGVCGGSGNNRTITFASLPVGPAGAFALISLVAQVNPLAAVGRLVRNEARVASSAFDPAGADNSSLASFTVVSPNNPPTAVCQNIVVRTSSQGGHCAASTGATSVDGGSFDPDGDPISLSFDPAVASLSTPGSVSVRLTATDSRGASSSCTGSLTLVDDTFPDINVQPAPSVEQQTAAGTPATDPAIDAFLRGTIAHDNCDGFFPVSHNAPSVFPLGPTPVTFQATDRAGNTRVAAATVNVVDTTRPVISGVPAPITVEQTSAAGAVVTFAMPTATDVCDANVPVTSLPASGSTFPLGTTTVTFTATDDSGNTATATMTVTVRDTTAPSASVTRSLIEVEQTALAGTPVNVLAASGFSATDLCDASLTITHNGPVTFPLGDTLVTIRATDDSGNFAEVRVTVRVRDTTPPNLIVPADLVVACTQLNLSGVGCAKLNNAAIQAWLASASATDICDATVTITNNAPAEFLVGFTTVTFTATDDSGNASMRTSRVQVVYQFGGFEPPLLMDGSASIKQQKTGRTIPVKFSISCGGTPAPNAVATISVFKLLDAAIGTVDTTDLTADSGMANENSNLFRYDAVGQHYIYNLSTMGYMAPATYRIFVNLEDGTQQFIDFSLRP